MSHLTEPVLFLNKSWAPVMVKPAADAITSVVKGDAEIMDVDFNLHNFSSWIERFDGQPPSNMKTVHGVRFSFQLPEIVVYTDYNGMPDLELRWGRKNLALRDTNNCQYCGCKVYGEDATIDHVVPKVRGGKNTWTNTVLACFPCNIRKGGRTPDEAGMVLRNKPIKPKWYPITARFSVTMPISWSKWIPNYSEHPLSI